MSEHFNNLTPAEAERLALLAEECGEVIQAIGKILRHGYECCHPDGGPTNRELLEKELGDLYVAIRLLRESHDVNGSEIQMHQAQKLTSIALYLHHQ